MALMRPAALPLVGVMYPACRIPLPAAYNYSKLCGRNREGNWTCAATWCDQPTAIYATSAFCVGRAGSDPEALGASSGAATRECLRCTRLHPVIS